MFVDLTAFILASVGGSLIALSTTLNLLLLGRTTGLSSIIYSVFSWELNEGLTWKVLFLSGMALSSFSLFQVTGGTIKGMEHFYTGYYNIWALLLGGFLVGVGTKLGNGCTSGHGISGVARLSLRSIVATILFMLFGLATATLLSRYDILALQRPDEYSDWGDYYLTTVMPYIRYGLIGAALMLGAGMFWYGYKIGKETRDVVVMVLALFLGVVFGVGLAVSGMCNPNKIIGFLRVNQDWDPTLLFVMFTALGICLITFQTILRTMNKPVILSKFPETKQTLDLPVILGPIIFGIGWGISGLCPGPGILNLFFLPQGFLFVAAMAFGMLLAGKAILPWLKSRSQATNTVTIGSGPVMAIGLSQ